MRQSAKLVFRWLSYLEGVSFLILLCIAMPLKYMFDHPQAVAITGAIHGLLFVLYLVGVVVMIFLFKWRIIRILGAVLAAFLPFGPFVFDRRLKLEA